MTAEPTRGVPDRGIMTPRRLIVVSIASATVAIAFGRFTYPLVLPALKRDLLASYTVVGLLGSLSFAAYLGASLFVTIKGHKLGPVTLVRRGVAGSALGLLILASAGSVWWLAVGMLLTGASGALVWISAPGLAASAVAADRRGWAIGLVATGIGLGVVVTGQLAAVTRGMDGSASWRVVWAIQAMLAAACLIFTLARRGETVGSGARAATLATLRKVRGWAGITLAYAAYGLSYSLFVSYLVAMLEADAEYDTSHSSQSFAVLGLFTAGAAVIGKLSDRFGRILVLSACLGTMAVAALAVLSHTEPWTTVSSATFGFTMSGVPVVVAAHIADNLPPEEFGAAFGAATLAFGVTQLTGPQLGGLIADHTGSFTLVYMLSSAIALAGAATATASNLALRPTRSRPVDTSGAPRRRGGGER